MGSSLWIASRNASLSSVLIEQFGLAFEKLNYDLTPNLIFACDGAGDSDDDRFEADVSGCKCLTDLDRILRPSRILNLEGILYATMS